MSIVCGAKLTPRSSVSPLEAARGRACYGNSKDYASLFRRPSRGVVKDHTECVSLARVDPAHAVAQRHTMVAASPTDRAVSRGEHERLALLEGDDLAAGLRPRPRLH